MSIEVGTQGSMNTASTTTNTITIRVNGVETTKQVTVVNREGTKTYIDSNGDEANGKEWKEDITTTETTTNL